MDEYTATLVTELPTSNEEIKWSPWFSNLLLVNCPLVIYAPTAANNDLRDTRNPNYPLKIINNDHEDNKFSLLNQVARDNPFKTKYILWTDPDSLKPTKIRVDNKYQDTLPTFATELAWPDRYKIQIIEHRFLVAYERMSSEGYPEFFGGQPEIIHEVYEKLSMNPSDCNIFKDVIRDEPEKFLVWTRKEQVHYQHRKVFMEYPIIHELATGTRMNKNYPIHPKIRVLTVATENFDEKKYRHWLSSVIYYGYKYTILGRNTKWKGFITKIELYLEALANVEEEFVLLTDCSDLFFVLPSYQAYERCASMKQTPVVGAEHRMYYNKGRSHTKIVRKHLRSIAPETQCAHGQRYSVNSGLIMGRPSELIELHKHHVGARDDQAACIDTICENRYPLAMDYDCDLVGNIPNYPIGPYEENSYYYDHRRKEHINKVTGKSPIMFHFPGHYWIQMHRFYRRYEIPPHDGNEYSHTPTFSWIF